jgi:uncharacterized protein YqgV (UPF0045/DUF77 family)
MTIEDSLLPSVTNIDSLIPIFDAALEKVSTWRKKPKYTAIGYGVAILAAALFFKHSDEIKDIVIKYGMRKGVDSMSTSEKAKYLADIFQVIPTLGAPLMSFFGYQNDGIDKVFVLINNVVNAIQAGQGMSSILKVLMGAVKR